MKALSSKTSTVRALKAVKDSLLARGWVRMDTGTNDGPCCILGHIALVTRGDVGKAYDKGNALQDRVKLTLAHELNDYPSSDPNNILFKFNDWDGQYKTENSSHVLKLLDDTIAKY